MPAAGQVGFHPVLERGQPRLLQPGHIRLGKREVGNVGKRRAPPQGERSAQPGGGSLGVAVVQFAARRGNQVLEPAGIKLAGLELQPVAGRLGQQGAGRRAKRPP